MALNDMPIALYHLGLAFLFAHELDAMTHSEWQRLAILRGLPTDVASSWFVALHVPLLFAILWFSHSTRDRLRESVRAVVAVFFVVHAVLHFGLSAREKHEFDGALSLALIAGTAACGLGYLAILWRRRHVRYRRRA